MEEKKLTYQQLENKLAVAEKIIEQLNGEIKAIKNIHDSALPGSRVLKETNIESEQNLRNLLDASPLGIVIFTRDENVVYANKAILDFCGYKTIEEFKTESVQQFYTPESYRVYREREENWLAGQPVPSEYEASVKRIDGEIINVRIIFNEVIWSGERRTMITCVDINEQKKVEQALKISEEKFSKVFRSSPEPIIITNFENGTIIDVNEAVLRGTGYSYNEMVGRTVFELNLWVNQEERKNMQRILTEKGRISSVRIQFRMKSGEIRTFNYSIEPIDIGGGKCIITVLSDITEREKAEEALRESEQKLRSIFSIAPIGIGKLVGSVLTEANQKFCDMLGYSYDEIINRDGRRIYLVEDEYESVIKERDYQLASGGTAILETKFRRKDGQIINVLLGYKPVISSDLSQGVIITGMDITERKRMENELRESEEKFAKAFRSGPEAVSITTYDSDAIILDTNETACKYTGYSYDELIGHSVYELGLWANPEDSQNVRHMLEEKGNVHAEIFPFRTKTGEIRTREFSAELIDIGGKKCVISIQSDITERIKAEETIKERDRVIHSIFSAAPIGIGLLSDNRIIEVNERYCNIVGYTRGELIGQKTRMLFASDEEHDFTGDTLFRQVSDGGYGIIETRLKHKSGTILDVTLSCAALDSADLDKGVVFTVTDITKHKKEQEALRESEERFRTLFETMAQGVVYQEIDGKISLANPAAQRILGLTLQQMQGRTSKDKRWRAIHEDGKEFPGEQHPAMVALRSGKPLRNVVMGVFNPVDDDYRWLMIDAIPEFKKGKKKPFRVYTLFRDITISRQLEEKIRYQAELIQTVSDAIVSSDKDLKLISWNKAAEELYGWKEEEVIGKNIMELLKTELNIPLKEMQKDMDKRGYWRGESVHYTRDGRRLNILDSVSIKRDNYGNNVGAVSVFKDITERKQMEESIRYHASLLENVLDAIVSCDTEYRVLSWNRAAEELYHWTKEEILGKRLLDVLKPVLINATSQDIDLSLEEKGYWNGEAVHQRKDESKLNVLESISLRRDAQGKRIGAVMVFKDITQRKKMEESLRYYANLVESVSDAVVSVDGEKRVISWNKAAEDLFGWSREEVSGRVILEFLPPHFVGVAPERAEEILKKEGKWTGEAIHYHKDGQKINTLESISLTKDENGETRGSVTIFKDITESKKWAEELANETARKRILVEQSRDGIVILEQDGKVHETNRRFAEMLGYSQEEVLKLHVWDWDTQWSKEHLLEMINTVTEAGDHFETYHKRKDGTTYDVEISSNGATFAGQKLVFCVCRDITERKRMEESIRYHASLIDNVSDAVVSSNMNYMILSWNRAAGRMYGWTEKEAIGKTIMEITAPVFLNTSGPDVLRILRQNGSWRGEVIHHRKDGKPLNVLASLSLMKDEKGRKQGVVSIFTDITERKQAEEKHQTILETALDGFHILDMNGRIIEVNDSYCRMTGYTREELLHMYIKDIEANKGTGPITRLAKMPERGYDRFETQHVCKDSRLIDLEVTLNYMNIGDGQVFSFLHDITERKRNEERIDLLNVTLRSIRNVNQIITREKDRNKLIKSISDALVESRSKVRAWIALFDSSLNLVTHAVSGPGKDFEVVADLLKQGKFPHCVAKALKGNSTVVTQSHDKICRGCLFAYDSSDYGSITVKLSYGDKTFGVLCVSAPSKMITEKDEVELYQEMATDIAFALYNIDLEAEHKVLEQERLRAAKLESIGTLAGGIAHDFNNLLTGILGNIGMAKLNIKPAEPAYELLDEAEKATVRTRDLTQQLLTFARGGKPVKKMVDIRALIKETATFALRGSQVKLELSLREKLWQIKADEGQISQVIQNLVINADEAMPDGGIIKISADNIASDKLKSLPLKPGNYIVINVKDTGSGMTPEQLQRVFEPYYTTKQRGSGLGLTSAFSIVRNHNGYIYAESTLGEGSTFHVYLPASKKNVKGGKKMTAEISGKAGGRILVMDDEPIIQRMLKQMLALLGYEVVITADGATAVKEYIEAMDAGNPFDVVIMDLTIPGGMGGKEAIKKLLEKDPAARVIVSSGYATDPIMSEYKKYGFSAVIAKPYTVHQLQDTLGEIIKKKKK